ncbi:ribonuclease H-like YkuK family protein [Bacillus sp. JCM 19041]|uniref:ribonuclease H-like YkuK family protein n=1 Tax=Bacillus sp. JCM 19041 TaxID=1460637 RepID=UPI0006D2C3B2
MNKTVYKSARGEWLSFDDVFLQIKAFMLSNPQFDYKVMVGTDSQVHARSTTFVTGVVVQRIGNGTWTCAKKVNVERNMTNLYERISQETAFTEEVLSEFTESHKLKLVNIVLPYLYKGADLQFEAHLDIGSSDRNRTRAYVKEMRSRIEALGFKASIKPNAFVASSYANRYTK